MSAPQSERRDVVLNVRGGARLCVPEKLRQITPYVLLEQEDWFEHEIRFVRRWLKPGMRVVDVGANYGVYTLAAALAVGREGRVWAFEPTPESAEYLERSLGLNVGISAKLVRLAISDHAGEVPFLLTGSPEENAVATDPGASGAVGLRAARLDDLAGEWGDVDFLKLDVEGHEAQAIRGGSRFLAERSPLVMLEIRSGRTFELGAARLLTGMGYSTYRLLPGPLILVPLDPEAPFDSMALNIFACKDDRAERLAAGGFLARAPLGAGGSPGAWTDYARAIPYARTLGAKWRVKPGFLAAPAEKAYHEGLAAFARSRDERQSAAVRAGSLSHALERVRFALDEDVTLSKQLSYSRICWELGQCDLALDALHPAVLRVNDEWRQALEEPFLAPGPRYDAVSAPERADDWLRCAIVEQIEKMRAFSSMFVRETVHEVLRPIIGLPYRSPEMDRRWQLARMAEGARPERIETLRVRSEENLNPQYWSA
jgi:FkbM family methyltransferase